MEETIKKFIHIIFFINFLNAISCFSANGQQLGFVKYYYFNNTLSYSEDLIVTKDSTLVFTGKAWKPSQPGNYFILKCNLSGDTIWYREGTLYDPLHPLSAVDNFGCFVKELSNGNYIIGGIIETSVFSMYIIGYSQTGVKEFERIYPISGYSVYPETMTQIDSSLYFFGKKCDSICVDIFFKMTLEGDSLSLIESNDYNIGFNPKASVQNNTYNIITAGNKLDSVFGGYRPSLKIIDTTGVIIDEFIFSGTVDDLAISVQWTADSMLLISTSKGSLIKADPTGTEIWAVQLPISNSFFEVIIINAEQYLIVSEFITFTWIDSSGALLDYNNYNPGFSGYIGGAIVFNDKIYISGSDHNPGPPGVSVSFLMQMSDSNLTNIGSLKLYSTDFVYPNVISKRSTCQFKIETSRKLKNISLYNTVGSMVFANDICTHCNEIFFDCSKTNPGQYILKVLYQDNVYSLHKIVIVQ